MQLIHAPSEILKAALKLDDRSAAEIARRSHVSKSALCRFIKGERGLSTQSFDRVSVSMGLNLKRLA